MTDTFNKVFGLGVIIIIVLACLGPCLSTGPPAVDPRVVQHQIELVNGALDALHEEVAAARSPSAWPFALFIGSILAPLAAGIWLLWRVEQSVIGHDAVIRIMVRAGLVGPLIRAYLAEQSSCKQLPTMPSPHRRLPRNRFHRSGHWQPRSERNPDSKDDEL